MPKVVLLVGGPHGSCPPAVYDRTAEFEAVEGTDPEIHQRSSNAACSSSKATTAASDFQPLATDSVVDTITIVLQPVLVIAKNVGTVSDPVNNTVNPKAIPGSEVLYTVTVTNTGPGIVDIDTFEITDAVPNDG